MSVKSSNKRRRAKSFPLATREGCRESKHVPNARFAHLTTLSTTASSLADCCRLESSPEVSHVNVMDGRVQEYHDWRACGVETDLCKYRHLKDSASELDLNAMFGALQ